MHLRWCLLSLATVGVTSEGISFVSGNRSQLLGPQQIVRWQASKLVDEVPLHWYRLLGPVGTVCITGDDRVGKSTLLSFWGSRLLARKGFEFPSSNSRQSHTQGLWSAILPAKESRDFHLNLCDSQGLKRVSEVEQWRLFAASVLVPQVLVYMLINVVQNDQLRDLARMAHQFRKLAVDQSGRFGRLLSPHLVVLVREESDLEGDATEASRNLSAHLEEALSGPGFSEDKELIRRVFQSREAWSLEELPKEGRRAVRSGEAETSPAAAEWRISAEAVLDRVLVALDRRKDAFPRAGPDLAGWYRSVVETVNSDGSNSLDRLIGHSERLDLSRQRQRLLKEWLGPVLAVLLVLATLSAFRGFIGVWVDRLAWIAWIVLCMCYLGSSPLIKTPLDGLAQRYCGSISMHAGQSMARAVCLEVSSQSAALVLACILGALSYPLLTAQFRWLLAYMPLPRFLRSSGAPLTLVLTATLLWGIQEVLTDVAFGERGNIWFLLGSSVIALSGGVAGIEVARDVAHNNFCAAASETGRALHFYVAERCESVAALEDSAAWAAHYGLHAERDALWRYRSRSVAYAASCFLEAFLLLIWAWLIYPNCDVVLALGALANGLRLLWKLASLLRNCSLGGRDQLSEWHDSLEDGDSDSDGKETDVADVTEACNFSEKLGPPPILPESDEEVQLRLRIESLRREQESGRMATRTTSRRGRRRTPQE